jgi:hypothetical protein
MLISAITQKLFELFVVYMFGNAMLAFAFVIVVFTVFALKLGLSWDVTGMVVAILLIVFGTYVLTWDIFGTIVILAGLLLFYLIYNKFLQGN